MICSSCKQRAFHIKVLNINGELKEICHNCSDLPIYGPNTDDKGVKAIYTDSKGRIFPVDKNGNVVDKKDNPYVNDSRGWKRAGKKINK